MTRLSNDPISCVESFTPQRVLIDQKVALRNQIQTYRTNTLPYRISEFVVVPEEMKARMHRRQHFVDNGFPGVDPLTGRVEGARRFVREKHVDAGQRLACQHFFAHEVTALVVS